MLTGSTAFALFPYMYMGLLSLILVPLVAICWSRAITLSAPGREGGQRNRVIAGLVSGTLVGGLILLRVAGSMFGHPGIHD